MSKRFRFLFFLALIASVVCSEVAHACADSNSVRGIQQAPCEPNSSQDGPLSKNKQENCDSLRYGMLSTQPSPSQAELFKVRALMVHEALPVVVSTANVLALFSPTRIPSFHRVGIVPHCSQVVLRI